ncbi:MAG: hypothetical protein IH891_03955 [Planctomycetes bacterium]|nr:hypothetical protein [Planctomycetota bacterium]
MAAIISRPLGSISGIGAIIDHLMVVIIHIATAIINVVVTFPEAIIAVITREHGTGGGITADITEPPETACVPTMREAFTGFPRFIYSRR